LGDEDARRLHAMVGAPPSLTDTPERASYWLAASLALTPVQRRAARDTVSTLTRLLIAYGVLCTAAEAGSPNGGRSGSAGGEGAGEGVVLPATNSSNNNNNLSFRSLDTATPFLSLVCFSSAGGEGGDDPDADLTEIFPMEGGFQNLFYRFLFKVLRVVYRVARRKEVFNFILLLGAFASMIYCNNSSGRFFHYLNLLNNNNN